jgi:hypothetical protein
MNVICGMNSVVPAGLKTKNAENPTLKRWASFMLSLRDRTKKLVHWAPSLSYPAVILVEPAFTKATGRR